MGRGLRISALFLAATLLLTGPSVADATVYSSCWVAISVNPDTGFKDQITRCRIAGESTVDYAGDSDVPVILYPALGTDANGECWYYTSAVTQYVIMARYLNGDAEIGFDPDPDTPGGLIAIGTTLPRCTSEPISSDASMTEVWQYVTQYIHPPPIPDLSPEPGDGVTGMETFVGLDLPEDHHATLSSGVISLEVRIEVSEVVIDWGDGTTNVYPAEEVFFAGYPDGLATHVYETKTSEGVLLSISYDWAVQWRAAGRSWDSLAVPNTTTTVDYPLAEIVSDLTD